MADQQFARIESKLHESRAEWQARLSAIRGDRRHEHTPLDTNLDDQAIQRENDETLDALDEMGRRELREIDAALRRLETGSYGRCAACGEAIQLDRLHAHPTAERCAKCAQSA